MVNVLKAFEYARSRLLLSSTMNLQNSYIFLSIKFVFNHITNKKSEKIRNVKRLYYYDVMCENCKFDMYNYLCISYDCKSDVYSQKKNILRIIMKKRMQSYVSTTDTLKLQCSMKT